jgi:hypothetical protein
MVQDRVQHPRRMENPSDPAAGGLRFVIAIVIAIFLRPAGGFAHKLSPMKEIARRT